MPTTRLAYDQMMNASESTTGIVQLATSAETLSGVNTVKVITPSTLKSSLDLKSNLNSPIFTGTPAAPTATTGTNTNQLATTAFVKNTLDAYTALPVITGNSNKILKVNATGDAIEWSALVAGTGITIGSNNSIALSTVAGMTVGDFGNDSNKSLNLTSGDSFKTNYISTDTYGRITEISEKTISIPAFEALPVQTGNAGKWLKTNGTIASWENYDYVNKCFRTNLKMEGIASTITLNANQWPDLGDTVAVEVYRNGILLSITEDYTIDYITKTITFVIPCATNDIVCVLVGNTVSLEEINKVYNRIDLVAIANQTTFTYTLDQWANSDVYGYAVYRNGILQRELVDFTLDSVNKSITFVDACADGELITIVIGFTHTKTFVNVAKTTKRFDNIATANQKDFVIAIADWPSDATADRFEVHRNGILMTNNADYTTDLVNRKISFITGCDVDDKVTIVISYGISEFSNGDGNANLTYNTYTLSTSDWSNKIQTIAVTGVTADNLVIVQPVPVSSSLYSSNNVVCTAQASGSLTFSCSTVPSGNINVNVMVVSTR